MIKREKFDTLTEDEKLLLAERIGYPDYENDDDLYDSLNEYWEDVLGLGNIDSRILLDIAKKLFE